MLWSLRQCSLVLLEAMCAITTTLVYSLNDTIYRFTDYNKAICRYIPYTIYRFVGCKIRVAAYGGKMDGVMRGHLALRQRASPSALPLFPTAGHPRGVL